MVTVGDIKKAIGRLDNMLFVNREELENAILPLFGPLQAAMPGMTFRDLTDLLIKKGWVTVDQGKILLKFPPESKEEPAKGTSSLSDQPPPFTQKYMGLLRTSFVVDTNLSFREIALMVHLNTNSLSRVNMGFDSLIAKGLVEYINLEDPISEDYASSIRHSMEIAKTQAVAAISKENFVGAAEIISDLLDAKRILMNVDMGWKLTAAGKSFMQDQPDSMLESPCD